MLQNSTFFFSCVFTCFNVHVLPSLRGKRRPAADTCDEPSVFMTVRAAVCQQQFFAAKTRSCQDRSLWSWRNCLWPHMPHSNFTHNSFTYNSLTLTQSLFHHLHATHTHFLTHNLLTHTTFSQATLSRATLSYVPVSHNLPSVISCLFVAFPIPSSPFFCNLLEEVDMWGCPVL